MEPLANERELIARARSGDRQAVSALYEGYVQAIFNYISYRVESDALAEDLTAEVFLRMVRSIRTYKDSGAPFGAWLYRIAANQIADYYRQRKGAAFQPLSDEQPNDDTDPLNSLAREEERSRLREALQALPEDYQTLLIMRFIQQMPHSQVAQVLKKSEANIRVMQHRALQALADALGTSKNRSYLRGQS
jgi:RNA polymerase sigma-70 factor (ECF subfamily)